MAAGDSGQLDDAVVLREDGAGEGVEDAGQEGVGPVDQNAALDALHPEGAFDGLLETLLVAVTSPMASSEVTR
ncbi:hypothetical protein D9M69_688200 [compost metagenome]